MRRRPLSIATAVAAALAGIGVGAPVATAADAPQYVQLGDSYSSGNGAGSYAEKICWRSSENYGEKVARRQGATYTNAACSGGVIADILNPWDIGSWRLRTRTFSVPQGAVDARAQWLHQAKEAELCGTPAQPDWSWTYTIDSSAAIGDLFTATVKCQLTAAPQIEAVTPQTDAVFLTIGGNDIGFTTIVTNCLVLRSAGGCKSAMDAANATIPQMKTRTTEALQAVHERSEGNAHVYLLGYPYLINTDAYELSSTYDAGEALSTMQERGDRVQRAAMEELSAATAGAGFTFVDVKPDWGGYAHGMETGALTGNPYSWLVPVLGTGREFSEWVHPRPAGWSASALALYAAMV